MDPITITAAISGARAAIGTIKNIQDIGHTLENVFSAQEQQKKKKQKAKPSTKMQQVLRIRAGDEGYDDETSISAVANQVLAEKQNKLALESLAKEIDTKWGAGTWNQILQQRKKLLAEKAASEQLLKDNALKKEKADRIFWHKFWVEAGKAVLIILFAGIMIGFVYWAATSPKIR
mgnify:FL=1